MLGYKYRRLTRPTLKCHEARKAQHSLSGAGAGTSSAYRPLLYPYPYSCTVSRAGRPTHRGPGYRSEGL